MSLLFAPSQDHESDVEAAPDNDGTEDNSTLNVSGLTVLAGGLVGESKPVRQVVEAEVRRSLDNCHSSRV